MPGACSGRYTAVIQSREVVMSGGGIGNGLEYWGIFKLSGDMDKDKLKDAIKKIQKVIEDNGGKIETEARANKADPKHQVSPSFSIGFKGFEPPS